MKILAVDSSGLVASVALVCDGCVTAEYTVNHRKTHSQTLLPMLSEITGMSETDLKSIDAIAVAAGPGSFTGLRIGSATVKGLGLALEKPVVPVPTAEGLAWQLYGCSALICPIMDARRSQVYTGFYEFIKTSEDGDYEFRVLKDQCALSIEDTVKQLCELGREVIFLGDGVPVYREYIREHITVPYSYAPVHRCYQSAAAVGCYAMKLFAEGRTESAAEHRPSYLRLSQAERERLEKQEQAGDSEQAGEPEQTEKQVQTGYSEQAGELLFRLMSEADLEVVSGMEEASFSEPWSPEVLRQTLGRKEYFCLVAEIHDRIEGYCFLRMVLDEAYISNVCVRTESRGRGIAQAMLSELIREGEVRGIRDFCLDVRAANETAIHVYEKLGFVREGVLKNHYRAPADDGIVMWRRQG